MSEQLHQGAALPPRGQLRWFKIASPTNGRSLRCVILGDAFYAKWTHWLPPTLPCADNPLCHHCVSGVPPRLNAYTPGVVGPGVQLRVIALTYYAACQMTELLAKRKTLRGLDVTLYRQFKSNKAPVVVRVEREIPESQLPPAFDVMDSLSRMWGVNRAFLERGCRRLGEDENAQKYMREEMQRRAEKGFGGIPTGEVA